MEWEVVGSNLPLTLTLTLTLALALALTLAPQGHSFLLSSFSCPLAVSSAPSPSNIAASSWSNSYRFLTLLQV